MIPFATDKVTLYNRKEGKDANGRTTVSWQRTVLTRCFWTRRMEKVLDGTTETLTEVLVCKIPQDSRYRSPAEWNELEDVTGCFTLAPGDIIVHGETTDEITGDFKAIDMISKHRFQGVMSVVSAKNNVRPGYPLGHYLARGA